jgi:DNA-binding response OmpR family regulator
LPKTILVVDDEPDVLEFIKLLLEGAGFDVVAVKDGFEGYSKANDFDFDLALIDVVMPSMTGIALLKRLKSGERTKEIPVILISVLDREVDRRMALDLGAVAFLTKPSDPQEMLLFVRSIRNFLEPYSEVTPKVSEETPKGIDIA